MTKTLLYPILPVRLSASASSDTVSLVHRVSGFHLLLNWSRYPALQAQNLQMVVKEESNRSVPVVAQAVIECSPRDLCASLGSVLTPVACPIEMCLPFAAFAILPVILVISYGLPTRPWQRLGGG